MAFKGTPKPPTSGRKKGTPNKNSFRLLDDLIERGKHPVEEVLAAIAAEGLSPARKLEGWLRILSHCYPTFKAIEMQGDFMSNVNLTPENIGQLCKIARQSVQEE